MPAGQSSGGGELGPREVWGTTTPKDSDSLKVLIKLPSMLGPLGLNINMIDDVSVPGASLESLVPLARY